MKYLFNKKKYGNKSIIIINNKNDNDKKVINFTFFKIDKKINISCSSINLSEKLELSDTCLLNKLHTEKKYLVSLYQAGKEN